MKKYIFFLLPKNGFSELDDAIWEKDYLPVFHELSKIKKVSLRKISVMDDGQIEEYARLAALVRPIVYNESFYKLSLLLLLTSQSITDQKRFVKLLN
jgi:hypothetical protein